MKEATGELNMTVVTVVAVAAVGAFFYLVIWPGIKANIQANTYCSSAVQCNEDRSQCHYYVENDSGAPTISTDTINCKDK
jgi:hypothetical protein